jgi:hypothetical protein
VLFGEILLPGFGAIMRKSLTDGDWDDAHPYFCADCGHQFGTERGFRISVEKDRD